MDGTSSDIMTVIHSDTLPITESVTVTADISSIGTVLTDGSCGDLHECRLRREHPSEEEEEEGVVAEGDHRLDHPEDGLVVPQQVLS